MAAWRKVVPRGSRLTPERLEKMRIGGDFLSAAEKELFVEIIFDYESAIAFDDSEMGMLKSEIELPIVIHMVAHKPWQEQNLRLPRAMQERATKIIKEKLANGMLEHSQGPYRSRYFLASKATSGEYRFLNDVRPLKKVTIRNVGMPPSVDEFLEDFVICPILTSVD